MANKKKEEGTSITLYSKVQTVNRYVGVYLPQNLGI